MSAIPVDAVAKGTTRLLALMADHAAACRELDRLDREREVVDSEDRSGSAVALAEGRPDPGSKRLAEHDAAASAARPKFQALGLAVTAAVQSFGALVEQHRDALVAKADTAITGATAEAVAALAKRADAMALRSWSRDYPSAKTFKASPGVVRGLIGPNGCAFGMPTVRRATCSARVHDRRRDGDRELMSGRPGR